MYQWYPQQGGCKFLMKCILDFGGADAWLTDHLIRHLHQSRAAGPENKDNQNHWYFHQKISTKQNIFVQIRIFAQKRL